MITRALAGLLLLGLSACAVQPPPPAPPKPTPPVDKAFFTPATWAQLPGWSADTSAAALPALRLSCQALVKRPAETSLGAGGTVADWLPFCQAITALPPQLDEAAILAVLTAHLQPWQVAGEQGAEGLFTGYYEPQLTGALARSARFNTPLHGVPADLVVADLGQFHEDLRGRTITGRVQNGKLVRYDNRGQIDAHGLEGRAPVLVWVDDPVAAFFLHIQGSGRVSLPDGQELRVGYAGQNGHAYLAIGKPLIERGALSRETVSMQSIRDWLKANPAEAKAVMDLNPSYIFFRVLEGPGPVGAQGVALTPGRSLAVDRRLLPLGAPVWLEAADPLVEGQKIQRLMVAQDTGGAIKGAVRGDVFWGHGAQAEERAGKMKSPGRFWLLLPRGVNPSAS